MSTIRNPMHAPSWPQAQTAKNAWNAIRSTNASDVDKRAAESSYVTALRKCLQEVGLLNQAV